MNCAQEKPQTYLPPLAQSSDSFLGRSIVHIDLALQVHTGPRVATEP